MNTAHTLTIIIPCHQSHDRLRMAIESSQWAQEIILIDQNSDIDWSTLHQQYRFSVIKHPQLHSFSEMKNQAMASASTNWIFFLDSDEFISPALRTEIQDAIQIEHIQALSVKRVDVFLGKTLLHGETGSHIFTRAIRMGKGKWRGAAHEKLLLSNTQDHIQQLHSPLIHEPHTSVAEFVHKINLYTSLLQRQSESHLVLKSIVLPIGKFIYTFFLKLGFLDGYRGLVYCFMMSLHSSMVRIKRYEVRKN